MSNFSENKKPSNTGPLVEFAQNAGEAGLAYQRNYAEPSETITKTAAINRRAIPFYAILLLALGACEKRDTNPPEIVFDLKGNIEDAARNSGVPGFQITKVAGAHLYNAAGLESRVVAHYTRPGFEVKIFPIFALTLYADEKNGDNLAVEEVDIQIANRFASDKAVVSLVDQTIAQFKKGKWRRLIPAHCPAVTGRSAMLDVRGEFNKTNECPLDPEYKISEQEWLVVLDANLSYEWVGDGIRATLDIASFGSPSKPDYLIGLTFRDAAIEERRAREKLLSELKDGNAKGWHSSTRYKAEQEQTEIKIRCLEENAIRRGDKVVPRS